MPNNIAGRFTTVAAVGNRIFLYGGRNEDGLLEMPIRIAATGKNEITSGCSTISSNLLFIRSFV